MPDAVTALLKDRSGDEAQRQHLLKNVFDQFDLDAELQYGIRDQVGNWGQVDILIPSRNTIVEVKSSSRATDPKKLGTGGNANESAYEQTKRYVLAESQRTSDLFALDKDLHDRRYLGVVTDGHMVWMWTWETFAQDGILDKEWDGRILQQPSDVQRFIERIKSQRKGRDWAPQDPSQEFEPFVHKFLNRFDEVKQLRHTETQLHLWKNQLLVGGHEVPSERSDLEKLFVLQSLLIAISRSVVACIEGTLKSKGVSMDGFVGWLNSQDWLGQDSGLFNCVDSFDWISPPADVLRPLFHGLMDTRYRKLYGEYYTPDWLAEGVVERVLDKEWILKQVSRIHEKSGLEGSGVLDPACGSGTFLYHATRRIVKVAEKSGLTSRFEQAELASRLVHGFDIHPVAVEMSKATLLRALPERPPIDPQVFQCDSLMTIRKMPEDRLQLLDETIELRSREGATLSLPIPFVLNEKFDRLLGDMVNSAIGGSRLPPHIKLDDDVTDLAIQDLHRELSEVIFNEGNDVWAWFIRNQSAAVALSKRKVDRIVTNPPWVRLSHIQDPKRKKEVSDLAKQQDLWVGGKNATGFDVASLFADYCPRLFFDLDRSFKMGWVLPQATLKGGNWEKFRQKKENELSETWDLETLPFPEHSKSCVRIEESGNSQLLARRMTKVAGVQIDGHDSWSKVQEKVKWTSVQRFPIQPSAWLDKQGKALARQGATLVPHCLIRISHVLNSSENLIETETVKSRHIPWKTIGTRKGKVPSHWIHDVVFSSDLVPYSTKSSKCILPLYTVHLDNGGGVGP